MADIEYSDAAGGEYPPAGVGMGQIVNWAGAALSLSLIAGVGWWGWQLLMRDVSGVPVVQALEGPMRIAPEDPGGEAAEYQGLAVNSIAAEGRAEAPADRLVLAPGPTRLSPEDQTMRVLDARRAAQAETATPGPARPEGAGAAGQAVPGGQFAPAAPAAPAAPVGSADADAGAASGQTETVPADTLAAAIEAALREATSEATSEAAPDKAAPQAAHGGRTPAEVAGLSRSLRPLPRPEGLAPAASGATTPEGAGSGPQAALPAAAPRPEAAIDDGVPSIAPEDIPPGTRLVQLGAFETAAMARAEWRRIAAAFGDFMAGKARVIEPAQNGGRKFYRLRVHGFEDLSDARRFCAALLSGQVGCIPLTTR